MTITSDQIVLAESQVMADTEDGGGRMSGEVVLDGEINNTMPDISRLDRVYGRVNLRKLSLSVRSANQDTLLGAHTIMIREPEDPRVCVTLFQTGSHTDRRDNARDRIESYVVKATEAQFWLWGDQLEGQRSISCLQRLNGIPPEPGDVYCIVSGNGNTEQYVRVTDVTVSTQTFIIQVGSSFQTFELQTLVLELANQLTTDFDGSDPQPTGRQSGTSRILSTQVADAARYYGAQKLAEDAAPGDLTVKLEGVYNNLVPSAQSETALTDRNGGPGQQPVIPASDSTITVNADDVNQDTAGYAIYYTGRAIVPGTLIIGGSNGNYSDDGGTLDHDSGSNRIDQSEIDYQNGSVRILWTSASYRNNPITLTFIPGAAMTQQSYSGSTLVTLANRSLTWIVQPRPIPAPGTLTVEYRALGRWQTLRDNGAGVLVGQGTGQINYATGTVEVTLAALPDVDTEIIYSWGDDTSADIQDGASDPVITEMEFNLTDAI